MAEQNQQSDAAAAIGRALMDIAQGITVLAVQVPLLVNVNVNSERLLQERIEQIREDIEYADHKGMVRAYNSSAGHGDFRLLKMNLRGAGPIPTSQTRGPTLSISNINTLLEAYGIAVPADAELQDKRVLFGRFIGVPL